MRIVIFSLAAMFGVACNNRQNLQCQQNASCDLSGGGMCLAASSGNMWCAYPDPECPGGYRYSTQDIGDGLSGECVPQDGVDAGVDSRPVDAAPAHFVVTYGGVAAESITDIHSASDGFVATGFLSSDATLGAFPLTFGGGYAFVVSKLASDGSVTWARAETTSGALLFAMGSGVSPNGDVIVAGYFTGTVNLGGSDLVSAGDYEMFIVKYRGSDGAYLWSIRYGSSGAERVQAVSVDSSGDIYLTGLFTGTANYGGGAQTSAGGNDVFVAKYSGNDGSYLWGLHAGGTSDDYPHTIAVADGAVTVCGVFRNTINFGDTNLVSAGADDIFLATFNATNGNHVWSERFGSAVATSNDNCASVAAADGSVYLTGGFVSPLTFGGMTLTTQGDSDLYVAKFDAATGSHLWSKSFGGTGTDVPTAVLPSGTDVVLTGYFGNTINFGGSDQPSAGGSDVFVATLKQSDGGYVDAFRTGGSQNDQGTALATDSDGLVVGGSFSGVTYFGTTQKTSVGGSDAFVFRP